MNPISHFLISWNVSALSAAEKRDRVLITLGGILPDIDSLGIVAELITKNSKNPLNLFSEYHHQLTHNITTAMVGAIAVFLMANPVRGRSSQRDDRKSETSTSILPKDNVKELVSDKISFTSNGAKRRLFTALVFLGVFHLHLLCDLIGARGPEGYQWPSNYLFPFSSAIQLTWQYQWPLNSWQNMVITISMLVMVFILVWKKGFSPLEVFSAKADRLFVQAVRKYKHDSPTNNE